MKESTKYLFRETKRLNVFVPFVSSGRRVDWVGPMDRMQCNMRRWNTIKKTCLYQSTTVQWRIRMYWRIRGGWKVQHTIVSRWGIVRRTWKVNKELRTTFLLGWWVWIFIFLYKSREFVTFCPRNCNFDAKYFVFLDSNLAPECVDLIF